jgi:anti-anti-sigma regulatory factor
MERGGITERRLKVQYELSRILASSPGVADGAPRLLEAIGRGLEASIGELWLVDRAEKAILCEHLWSTPELADSDFVSGSRGRSFPSGVGLPGRVWATGQPIWIADVAEDATFKRHGKATRLGLRGSVAFPVHFAGRLTGALVFFQQARSERTDESVEIFADVGAQVGFFLERVRMSDALVRQAREILELSTPILPIAEHVLAVPVIGALDSARAAQLLERLLARIEKSQARLVLLDLTGVATIDTFIARSFLDIVDAAKLLGARVVLTGVRPAIAQTLVRLGVPIGADMAYATLAEGVRRALERP